MPSFMYIPESEKEQELGAEIGALFYSELANDMIKNNIPDEGLMLFMEFEIAKKKAPKEGKVIDDFMSEDPSIFLIYGPQKLRKITDYLNFVAGGKAQEKKDKKERKEAPLRSSAPPPSQQAAEQAQAQEQKDKKERKAAPLRSSAPQVQVQQARSDSPPPLPSELFPSSDTDSDTDTDHRSKSAFVNFHRQRAVTTLWDEFQKMPDTELKQKFQKFWKDKTPPTEEQLRQAIKQMKDYNSKGLQFHVENKHSVPQTGVLSGFVESVGEGLLSIGDALAAPFVGDAKDSSPNPDYKHSDSDDDVTPKTFDEFDSLPESSKKHEIIKKMAAMGRNPTEAEVRKAIHDIKKSSVDLPWDEESANSFPWQSCRPRVFSPTCKDNNAKACNLSHQFGFRF